jgi:hypothetical protein
MGRRKGSKNKNKLQEKITVTPKDFLGDTTTPHCGSIASVGRPVGAKNKPKEIKETAQEIKRIRKEIKDLRTQKRLLPKGSEERIKAHRAMQELKKLLIEKKEAKVELVNNTAPDPLKEKVIEQIKDIDPECIKYGIDLNKFSLTQLQLHLELIKQRREK